MIEPSGKLEERIADVVERYLSLGAVVIVGAGLSISSRFPDTEGLTPLLWDALDSDLDSRGELARRLGRADTSAKKLIGKNSTDREAAWAAIASSSTARGKFQAQFASLDKRRSSEPSVPHEALACLIHARVVECVVSLNWDTALEKAYGRRYGTSLPDGLLFKPHGDAARPEDPWIFPHVCYDPDLVLPEVIEKLTHLVSEHPRILLIIGYSESDQKVVDGVIKPLDTSWPIVRVGPGVTGSEDLPAEAEVVLSVLASRYTEKEDGSSWYPVSFSGQRSILPALKGERLDPRDVDSCPKMDEVEVLVQSLLADKAVVFNGQTGSGKSITAYQALHRLTHEGFEILRLRDDARQKNLNKWLIDLAPFPHKKVLLVDDAQDQSPDTVRELAEAATPDRLVLIVGTDHVAGGERTVRLSARSAVACLSRFVQEERTTLFPLIQDLDDQVGTHPNDELFDYRIYVAERQRTPWQFFYTLTRGWRRIRYEAMELSDIDRADLALLALAVAQIAGVDAGAPRDELSAMLCVLGKDEVWLDRSLDTLRDRRLMIEADGRLRCTHLRAACNMIEWMLHPPKFSITPFQRVVIPPIASAANQVPSKPTVEPMPLIERPDPSLSEAEMNVDRTTTCALIEHALDSPGTPLRGCAWLSGSMSPGMHRTLVDKGVLSPRRYEKLARRALSTPADGDVAAAAKLLIQTVIYSRGSVMETVKAHESRLFDWYRAISPENGGALGDLVQILYDGDKEDKGFALEVAQYADAKRLADIILQGGWPHIDSTTHALDQICSTGGQAVREAVAAMMDEGKYKQMLSTGDPDVDQSAKLIHQVASADPDLSLRLFEHAAPMLALQFMKDPVGQWSYMWQLARNLGISVLGISDLGYGLDFLHPPKRPSSKCRKAARSFIRRLDRQRIADTIGGPNDQWDEMCFDLFVKFLYEADPTTFADIVGRVDLAAFENSLRSNPENPDSTALYVCAFLWRHRPDPVHEILDRLEPDLTHLDSLVAYMAPDVATRALRRGLPLNLHLDLHEWGWAATVLTRLHHHDQQVAQEVAYANREGMRVGLIIEPMIDTLERDSYEWDLFEWDAFEWLNKWVSVCDEIAPGLVDSVIHDLSEGAVSRWAFAFVRQPKNCPSGRKEIAPLVHRAARMDGHVQKEAKTLIKRFRALSREGLVREGSR